MPLSAALTPLPVGRENCPRSVKFLTDEDHQARRLIAYQHRHLGTKMNAAQGQPSSDDDKDETEDKGKDKDKDEETEDKGKDEEDEDEEEHDEEGQDEDGQDEDEQRQLAVRSRFLD